MVNKYNKIDTVIFDMDGTTLNTLVDLAKAVNYVLSSFDMPTHEIEEYRKWFGNGIRYAIRCAVPESTSEETIDKMLPVFKEYYGAHCLDETRPYDGILDLMKVLKEHGYKMAIVSNKIDPAVKELNNRFFKDYVDVAIGERDGIRRKPAPDTVIEALKELGSTEETSIYIGDSEVDFETANNSNLPSILVLWGFRDKDYLIKIGAKELANTPMDIFKILTSK